MRRRLHRDKPLIVQYFMWLGDTATGNLGDSIQYNTPVAT